MINLMKTKRAAYALPALFLSTLCLSGCVSVLPDAAPPDTTYRLLSLGQGVQAAPNAVVVRIDRPGGLNVFETADILVSPDGRRLSTAAKAKWAELLPFMLQESLMDYMTQTPNLIGVLPTSNARTDTRLYLTIKNFEAQFDRGEGNAPLAVVKYSVALVNAFDRKLIDKFETRQTLRASEARVSSIVKALEEANGAAMRDIIEWVETKDLPRGRS